MLALRLDPESPADELGFRALRATADAVGSLPDSSWRIVGGWMVRAWVEGRGASHGPRPTVDVDLALLASRSDGRAHEAPDRLRADGLAPREEPFRLVSDDELMVDILVPPGASRSDPPRIGKHAAFEAPGSRFAFELPPEPVEVTLGRRALRFLTARLAGALVVKAVTLGRARPLRVRDDAVDVARLLEVTREAPEEVLEDLRRHRRRSDVREAVERLRTLFTDEDARGAIMVAQEAGATAALNAVVNAGWVVGEILDGG